MVAFNSNYNVLLEIIRLSFTPTDLNDLLAWYQFNTGITEAGTGVSAWDDQYVNARHLLQGTDANRPSNSSGIITHNGTSDFMTVAWTQAQPITVYMLIRPLSHTVDDWFMDGVEADTGPLKQSGTSPEVSFVAGGTVFGTSNDLTLNVWHRVCVVMNGASSIGRIDDNADVTGSGGSTNMNGIFLGSFFGVANYAHFDVKEIILSGEADDSDTRDNVMSYLATV